MLYKFGMQDMQDMDGVITVQPSSRSTAEVDPVDITVTDRLRLRLIPKLINNPNNAENSISAKLVFEKKCPSDDTFPSERTDAIKTSRQDIKFGDWLELSLSSSDVASLAQCIAKMYDLYSAAGIPRGTTRYIEADAITAQTISVIRRDPSSAYLLSREENYDIVRTVLDIIAQSQSRDALHTMLAGLQEDSIQRLSISLNAEQLMRAAAEYEENIENGEEEYWQSSMFGRYPWILSQVFSSPVVLFSKKAYVGGKNVFNTDGNECDYIYKNHMTNNVCLIEIKTPKTPLLGKRYRGSESHGTYSLSAELSGAVNQVLNYRDSLSKEYAFLAMRTDINFEVFTPRCAVIIGNASELDTNGKLSTFENYRNSLNGVIILTYDELLQRIKDIIEIIRADD